MSIDPLEKLREWISALPETSEKLSHGSPTFWGGKKTFASFHLDHHGDGRTAIWCKMPPDAQEMLVAANPRRFFVPPYVGPSGWVGIDLDDIDLADEADCSEIMELLEEGYRMVAPKRALEQLDSQSRFRPP
jgi:hypothetical protein